MLEIYNAISFEDYKKLKSSNFKIWWHEDITLSDMKMWASNDVFLLYNLFMQPFGPFMYVKNLDYCFLTV